MTLDGLVAADALEGDRVVNRQGEDLGDIHDIMIDVRRGCVAYAVMSRDGGGDKLFAIPWQALTVDAERDCFVLDDESYGVRPYLSEVSREI